MKRYAFSGALVCALLLSDLIKHTSEVCNRRLDASKQFAKKFFSGRDSSQCLNTCLIVVVSFNDTCN